MKFVVFGVLILAVYSNATLTQCQIKLEPIGCFTDNVDDRALQNEIINERDPTSKVYNGQLIDWPNYHIFLPTFICRCAEIAWKKGYRVIGVQFYGECWGQLNGEDFYYRHGKSDKCVNGHLKDYDGDNSKCAAVTGMQQSNFIYRIAPTECDGAYYEPVGCYKDDLLTPRPLPFYIQNERDYTASNWNNILIDWQNWNTYSPEMICRCAKKAQVRKNKLFSIQFWGECWSSNDPINSFDRFGTSSNCRGKNFDNCSCNSYHCVGMERTNHVYRLISPPSQPEKPLPEFVVN